MACATPTANGSSMKVSAAPRNAWPVPFSMDLYIAQPDHGPKVPWPKHARRLEWQPMKPEQKTVAIGAASGVVSMIVLVWLLTHWLPTPAGIESTADRIALALRINVVALLPFFVMIVSIANSRFLSDAIDPTLQAESQTQIV